MYRAGEVRTTTPRTVTNFRPSFDANRRLAMDRATVACSRGGELLPASGESPAGSPDTPVCEFGLPAEEAWTVSEGIDCNSVSVARRARTFRHTPPEEYDLSPIRPFCLQPESVIDAATRIPPDGSVADARISQPTTINRK